MAEVLGLVASGISVAQVAGSILTNSLKLKALLDEVKDAPDNLKSMLDHLELLTPIISEAMDDVGDVTSTISTPLSASSHPRQALQRALRTCQMAAEQLELLVNDLTSNINAAGGGARRKRAVGAVKVVLKKGVIAQHEMRLQKTVQLLTLAQNAYLIALQRTQPETIISQVKLALAQSTSAAHGHVVEESRDAASCTSQIATRPAGPPIPMDRGAGCLHEYLTLGLANVTGLVQVHTSSDDEDRQASASKHPRHLRVQVRMPAWLCTSIFDAVFSRSYAGWTCSLTVYGNIIDGSEEYRLVTDAISTGDVARIYRLFQERRCNPLDRLISTGWRRSEFSLIEYALLYDSWGAARYLLNHGTMYDEASEAVGTITMSTRSEYHLEYILNHDMFSDSERMSCLASYTDDLTSFTTLVGRVWPCNSFYETAFEDQRLELAMRLAQRLVDRISLPSPTLFLHLCESLSLETADAGSTTMALSYLSVLLGEIVWHDPIPGADWHRAIRDTVLRLNKAFLMPQEQLCEDRAYPMFHFAMLFDIATPFTNLFLESMVALPSGNSDPGRARQHKVAGRLAECERTLHIWLEILQDCGIDLVEYGIQIKEIMDDEESGYNYRIFRNVRSGGEGVLTKNGLFEIKLIGFEYGVQPGDWKLWWSEPTDELVGDFWREMEPQALRIPGTWVDD